MAEQHTAEIQTQSPREILSNGLYYLRQELLLLNTPKLIKKLSPEHPGRDSGINFGISISKDLDSISQKVKEAEPDQTQVTVQQFGHMSPEAIEDVSKLLGSSKQTLTKSETARIVQQLGIIENPEDPLKFYIRRIGDNNLVFVYAKNTEGRNVRSYLLELPQ